MISRTAWSTEGVPGKRSTETSSQKVKNYKIKIKEIEVNIKPCKDEKYTESWDTISYYVLFELFEC